MNTLTFHRWALLPALLLVFTTACATTGIPSAPVTSPTGIARENDTIRPVVEALAVNVHELRLAYEDLHVSAQEALTGTDPDRQLDYIQKVYLHVNAALLVSEYQYAMLSVIHYVKDARRKDYLTLRARSLDQARTRLEDALQFIALYGAFITHPKATAAIARARALIEGNRYLYAELLEILAPLVHPAGAFTPDPYAPI